VTVKPILQSKHVGPDARLLQATILVDSRHSGEAASVLNGLLHERQLSRGRPFVLARILWESESLDAEKLRRLRGTARKPGLASGDRRSLFPAGHDGPTVKEQLPRWTKLWSFPDHYESLRLRAFTYYASRNMNA